MRRLIVILMYALLATAAGAQDVDCPIVIMSGEADETQVTWYVLHGDAYEPEPRAAVHWLMGSDAALAYLDDELPDGRAVQLIRQDGTPLATYPVDEATFARFNWLSGTHFAVTNCIEDDCSAAVFDIETGKEFTLDLGPYLPAVHLAWRESYVVTRLSDGVPGLWDESGAFRPYASDQVTSTPLLSANGRYLAFRLTTDDGPRLRVLDLIDSKLNRTLPLHDEMPTPDAGDTHGLYPPLPAFGRWHPAAPALLYTDGGAAHVYDALAAREVATIEDIGAVHPYKTPLIDADIALINPPAPAMWVCPPAP